MTVRFATSDPNALLTEFKKFINQKEAKGKIKSWIEADGGFRHNSDWKDKALFKVTIPEDKKHFDFYLAESKEEFAYAYYHGHILQTFIEHLNSKFSTASFFDRRKN
ncbi:hypothetical protein CU664_14990 [Pseudomonas syringae pv. actinidifoliorum]|uniref:hypothetical protein n=1 Tax=Pseudomonas syringae TaxID=317 RepID=UPI00137316BC|nr:hypothetical protein [Pseudomonas syringae]NAS96665.1 hypothetical protein [Pseudomonas syringae pv. actinidifoliorum]NAT64496.1 hypothetical protein [Pseudomonas syringae pv. actinidifoliorum]